MNNAATTNGSSPMPPPRTSSHRTPNTASAAAQPSRTRDESRRREKDSPSSRQPGSSGRAQPGHSRSATAIGQPPVGTSLPREESAVINRIVVSDTQDDIARAQARQGDGPPVTSGADLTPITGLSLVGSEGVDDGGRGGGAAVGAKSRQDHSKSENAKRSKFGNYILGQTLGEGEFGKVKMGWKRDSSVEVAIKLIRRETLGSNSNRLQKIYREIHILRGLDHPNIVRLHEMVETERHIGIILEYASGGELFDYILNHRYLKDGPARKLFSQLISGVGYLHRKGIVHRDLKLENLLLDRNKNIIITDFGFANTFDPNDELSEEIEYRLGDKDYIRSLGLEGTDAARRGDLMQTSCGSPCYAAPELVVSDSLYTGRKVDVWSCGVILVSLQTCDCTSLLTSYSMPCWLVTCLSMTIQRTPRVTTSTYSTSISCPRR
jgi:protein-serine/threonine kinase